MLSVIIWLLYLLRGWIITFIKVTGLLRQARHLANFRSAETATAAAARCTAALLYLLIRLFDFLIYETKILKVYEESKPFQIEGYCIFEAREKNNFKKQVRLVRYFCEAYGRAAGRKREFEMHP